MTNSGNLILYTNLFNNFAHLWQEVAESGLFLLSLEGEILAQSSLTSDFVIDGSHIISHPLTEQIVSTVVNQRQLLVTPIYQDSQLVGYLVGIDSAPEHKALLSWIADSLSANLNHEELIQGLTDELIVAWNQLELIYHVTENLALTSNLTDALQSIIKEIQKVTKVEDVFILTQEKQGINCISSRDSSPVLYRHSTLFNHVLSQNGVLLCHSHEACAQIWVDCPETIETLLAVKIPIIQESTDAMIGLVNKDKQSFNTGDTKLVTALAPQLGLVIKNSLIYKRLVTNERLAREREIAAQIQNNTLPHNPPQMGGVSIAVSSILGSEAGGDFYDFITIDDQYLTVVIGDVSGKGISAATLTTVVRAILRSEIMRGVEPHLVIERANELLHHDLNAAEAFITALVAKIDTYNGILSYANAGHLIGLLRQTKQNHTELLKATCLPIGLHGYENHLTKTIKLNSGDNLVLVTDGIVEAQSPKGDTFGLHRLRYIIENRANDLPEQLQHFIRSEISQFRLGNSAVHSEQDDATLLIVKMLAQPDSLTSKDISTIIKTAKYTYHADTEHLAEISQKVTAICQEIPSLAGQANAKDFVHLVELATSEICTNIIRHAYQGKGGELNLHVTVLNNGIQLDLYDNGIGFDPNSIPVPKKPQEGGYGLHIIRQIMDVVSYEHDPKQGNHWHLIKMHASKP